ncbi:MAG: glycoside hydrolase domain-containing protein [Planctomycetota bacterium]
MQARKSGTRFTALCVTFLLSIALTASAQDDWVLSFEDLFDRDKLGPDWTVLDGELRTVYDAPNGIGTLYAKGEALLLRSFPGDVRVEIEARSADPGDLSLTLATNNRGFQGGYFLGFGSEANTLSKILRLGKKVAVSASVIKPNELHKIVAEKTGSIVTLAVDGVELMRFDDPSPLAGPSHAMVGLYVFNLASVDCFRVYGRKGAVPLKLSEPVKMEDTAPAQEPANPKSPPADLVANLLANTSFEDVVPGRWPRFAAAWLPEYSAVGDRTLLIKDAHEAHSGDRFLRLSGNGPWMKIHSAGPEGSGVPLDAGKSYTLRAWARAASPSPSSLQFYPSEKKFDLGPGWQECLTTWQVPDNLAKQFKGFYLKAFGPVDVDDVTLCESSGDVAPASAGSANLRADWTALKTIPPKTRWLSLTGRPPYQERISLELLNLFEEPAAETPVGVPVEEVFGALAGYDFVSLDRIVVVEGRSGRSVPFAFQEIDLQPGVTRRDHLVFLASVPPRSRSAYYVYLRDRHPIPEPAQIPSTLPDPLASYDKDSRRLRVETVKIERIGTLRIQMQGASVLVEVTSPDKLPVTGRALSPDAATEIDIPFQQGPSSLLLDGPPSPFVIRHSSFDISSSSRVPSPDAPLWSATIPLGPGPAKGIWSVLVDIAGARLQSQGAFVVDAGIWASGNLYAVRSDDPPQPGRSCASLLAARGERESFQVVIAAARDLPQVALRAGALRHTASAASIPADCWTLERVEEVFVGAANISPELRLVDGDYVNVGNFPDPLLPWRRHDVVAGRQRVCLATLRVPEAIPAGDYCGEIAAEAADGTSLLLPVTLHVCDFDMPKRPGFLTMISGLGAFVRMPADREGKLGKDVRFYHLWDRDAQDAIAAFVAERWMTPSLTGAPFGANAIPWTYDEQTRTATLDFSRFDANAEILIDKLGVDFLSIPWSSGWRVVGRIHTYPRVEDWPTGWGTIFKDSPGRISKKFDTEDGLRMLEDYARALGKHLEERGWLDRVGIYIVDEPKSPEVYEAVLKTAEAIRRGHPKLKMWAAAYGTQWHPYFDYLSVFTGQISPEVRDKCRDKGIRYLGIYNQTIDTLPMARAVPLMGASRGWDGYYHHETTTNQDLWVNPEPPVWTSPYAPQYAAGGPDSWLLIGGLIYHWPQDELDEPLPDGKDRAWASSLRVEALREATEDVEYLLLLRALADKSPPGSQTRARLNQLEGKLSRWLSEGALTLSHNRYYNYRLSEEGLNEIRRDLCDAVVQARAAP